MGKDVTSTIWEKNVIKFKNDYYGINPIRFTFSDWPKTVKIKLDIYDDDGYWGYEFVDRIGYTFKERKVKPVSKAKSTKLELAGTATKVKLLVRVFCSANYYGKDCTIFCEDRDDEQGHFKCDPITGERSCRIGWTGDDCLQNPDDCEGNRCHGGATCIDELGFYTCQCPPGKAGTFCQGEINECLSQPCLNGGTCNDLLNDFSCDCPRGWGGPTCERAIKPCTDLTCVHGYCTRNENGTQMCVCDTGYRGRRCQVPIGQCDHDPCGDNSLACYNLAGDYRCKCKPGFFGRNCERRILNCDSAPCQNGGECCEDQVVGYHCNCLPGYLGYLCELKTDECASSPCQNGGFCKDKHLGFECLCRGVGTGESLGGTWRVLSFQPGFDSFILFQLGIYIMSLSLKLFNTSSTV
ncbi:hypothetical protein RRG08_049258 [Elysia crispata]|uniref:Delta-like protein n=1 Tax=Elysia crispata TaxID=231223 RepID=A0AAE1DKI6_9GAST|nr:hypothetical protein RRG08_049258 [Elysia crispata]